MPIKIVLNSVTHYKSFVLKKVHLHKTGNELQHIDIDIEIIPRKNSPPIFFAYKNIAVKIRRCSCKDHAGTEGEEQRSKKVQKVCSDMLNFSDKANESRNGSQRNERIEPANDPVPL